MGMTEKTRDDLNHLTSELNRASQVLRTVNSVAKDTEVEENEDTGLSWIMHRTREEIAGALGMIQDAKDRITDALAK